MRNLRIGIISFIQNPISFFLSFPTKLKKRETTSVKSLVAGDSIQFCQVWVARRVAMTKRDVVIKLASTLQPMEDKWFRGKIHFRAWSPVHILDNALFRRIRRMGNSIPIRNMGHKGDFGRHHVMGPRVCYVNYVKSVTVANEQDRNFLGRSPKIIQES